MTGRCGGWICCLAILAVLSGCDMDRLREPPIAITFRQGLLSASVMCVSNLSTAEGIEVYFYVANDSTSMRSGNTVIPANGKCEYGSLEINWTFNPGDKGFVKAPKYGKKLFFVIEEGGSYKTWFGLDDIPEVDVAARVRAQKEVARLAKIKTDIGVACAEATTLYVAITNANAASIAAGKGSAWPKAKQPVPLTERAKEKIGEWKSKISEKLNKSEVSKANTDGSADVLPVEFSNSSEFLSKLFGIESAKPYESAWSVLADYDGSISPSIPILVSANLACDNLLSAWDGVADKDVVIPIQDVGVLSSNAVVMVYCDGRVISLDAEDVTLGGIYGSAFNTCTNGYNQSLRYLTPHGVVQLAVPVPR